MLQVFILFLYLYNARGDVGSPAQCDPIPAHLTSPKTGQKAWDKCVEYQKTLVYPCEEGGRGRSNHCSHNNEELIIGGAEGARNEFPHEALLGYGELSNVKWLCGGVLISDRFIVAPAHCSSSREEGPVAFVQLGDPERQYKVKQVHKHPDFKAPIKYNDIALLETEDTIKLDQFTVPACLPVGDDAAVDRALATEWTTFGKAGKPVLLKTMFKKFTESECSEIYSVTRLLRNGINSTTQFCYGYDSTHKPTCQEGNFGGPLQVKSNKLNCMYIHTGVSSFGRRCSGPDVFTRVEAYVPWIESIVWP